MQQRKNRLFDITSVDDIIERAQSVRPVREGAIRIPLDLIDPNPRNPRQRENIEELAASMAAYGLMQPVVIRPKGQRYELVAGHRRVAAARHLGWTEIEAIVREESDDLNAYILTLTENLQREDLTPREEAAALEVLVREQGWSTRQVAERVKRSPAYISKRLRVFEDDVLAPLVLSNRLAVSTAELLLSLPPEERRAVAERAAEEFWGQQAVRRYLAERAGRRPVVLAESVDATRHNVERGEGIPIGPGGASMGESGGGVASLSIPSSPAELPSMLVRSSVSRSQGAAEASPSDAEVFCNKTLSSIDEDPVDAGSKVFCNKTLSSSLEDRSIPLEALNAELARVLQGFLDASAAARLRVLQALQHGATLPPVSRARVARELEAWRRLLDGLEAP